MKKTIIAVMLIICAGFIYGQSSPIDLILVLDTSQGMSSSYENVTNYLTGDFLTEFLRVGDTFHLIAFNQNQRLDAARRINGVGDLETIVGRMLLQYPVETGRNVADALSYTERYASSLPSRPKKIVLITTAGAANLISSSRQRFGSNTTLDLIEVTGGQPLRNLPSSGRTPLRTAVTPAPVIRTTAAAPTTPAASTTTPASTTPAATTAPPASTSTPVATPAASTTAPASTPAASSTTAPATATTTSATSTTAPASTATSTTTPAAVTPVAAASVAPAATAPVTAAPSTIEPPAPEPAVTSPAPTVPEAVTPAAAPVSTPSAAEDTGIASGTTSAQESQTAQQTTPASTSSSAAGAKISSSSKGSFAFSLPLIIGLIIAALLILGLIIFLVTRKLSSSPNRVMSQASSPKTTSSDSADHSSELAKFAAAPARRSTPYEDRSTKEKPVINPDGPLMLNLFVQDQNTNIGKRNIHSLKSGYKFTVGGGKSDDFLIFLVPIPAHIGEIRRDGSQLTFIPHKEKYFPDTGANEVTDCINKTIRIVSDKHYEIRFHFEMYEDPLIALNRLLTSVNVPG